MYIQVFSPRQAFFFFLLAHFCLQTFSELCFKWKHGMEKKVLITIENSKFSSNLRGFRCSTRVCCRNSPNQQWKQSSAVLQLAYLYKWQAFSSVSTYISYVLTLCDRVCYSIAACTLFPTYIRHHTELCSGLSERIFVSIDRVNNWWQNGLIIFKVISFNSVSIIPYCWANNP